MLAVSILGKKFGCEAEIEVGLKQYESCILFLMKWDILLFNFRPYKQRNVQTFCGIEHLWLIMIQGELEKTQDNEN